jgi:hypothetical protein
MIMLPSVVGEPNDNVTGPVPFFRIDMTALIIVVAVDRWTTAKGPQLPTYPQPVVRQPA